VSGHYEGVIMKRDKRKKYLHWDTDTFGIGLEYILNILPTAKGKKAIELGANYGGLSVCLANEKLYEIICSDLDNPRKKVLSKHPEIEDNPAVSFDNVNGLDIKYSDNSFDLVIFKSVLGYISSKEQQQQFINEIHRVLRPGGYFCFLENAQASCLHRFARKKFVAWGTHWRYVTLNEMQKYVSAFSSYEIKTNGFFTAFVRSESLRYIAFLLDKIIVPFIPKLWRYVIYGIAIK
jgi:ubiquinone/menaquinone biosynthesis C-methylase UbiE